MLLIFSLISFVLFLLFFFFFFKNIRKENWLLHPFFWFSLTVFLNCPLRAILLDQGLQDPVMAIEKKYMLIALGYGTLFYVLSAIFCYLFSFSKLSVFKPLNKRYFNRLSYKDECLFVYFMMFLVIAGYIYGIITNSFNFIDSDVDRITQHSIIKMIAMNISSFVYFSFAVVLLSKDKYSFRDTAILILVVLLLTIRGVTSGGRGYILIGFYLVIMYLAFKFGLKKALRFSIVILIPVVLIIAGVTYFRVGGGNIYYERGVINYNAIRFMANRVFEESSFVRVRENLDHMVFRVTYHLDVWAFLLKQWNDNELRDKGPYALGSIYDLRHLIPRIMWPSRDVQDFNYWMGSYLFNANYMMLNYPIGRIGESLYAFGPFGFVFSILNSFFIVFLFNKFFLSSDKVLRIAYVAFHISWSIQGQATIFWNMVNPIKNAIYYFIVWLLFFIIIRMQKNE